MKFLCYLCNTKIEYDSLYHIECDNNINTHYFNYSICFCKDFKECNKTIGLKSYAYETIKINKIKEFKLRMKFNILLNEYT